MPNIIIWDVDDTLIEWTTPFVKWLFKNKIKEIDTHNPSSWFTLDNIREFNKSKEFIKRKAYRKNVAFYKKLHETNTFKHVILTACGTYAKEAMVKCLELNSIQACEIEVVNSSEEKYQHILNYKDQGSVIVFDDKIDTRNFCHRNNIKTFDLHKFVDYVDKHKALVESITLDNFMGYVKCTK